MAGFLPCPGLFSGLEARVLSPSDSVATKQKKRTFVHMNFCVAFIGLVAGLLRGWPSGGPSLYSAVCAVVSLMWLMATKRVSDTLVNCTMLVYAIFFVVLDWRQAVNLGARSWTYIVLLLDLTLSLGGSKQLPNVLLTIAILGMCVASAEGTYRFGLFDALDTLGLKEGRTVCDCEEPPCASGSIAQFLIDILSATTVLCLDYFITRSFARSMQKGHCAMELSIRTAEDIANALAAFDLDQASAHLSRSELPGDLYHALNKILLNLTSYKPYLPEAILSPSGSNLPTTECVPGLSTGCAAIVFTDILSSTATWNTMPRAMKSGLRKHNMALRAVLRTFNGYEVKTIGDSFMVAFQTLDDALGFALGSQVELYQQHWPEELSELPQCSVEKGAWNGLRIRIGVHYGDIEVEKNCLSDRYDYHGSTVNKAARLEAACPPGMVAVETKALSSGCAILDSALVVETKLVSLRGVGDVNVSVLLPEELSSRAQQPNVTYHESQAVIVEPTTSDSATSLVRPQMSTLFAGDETFVTSTIGHVTLRGRGDERTSTVQAASDMNDGLSCVQGALDRSDGRVQVVLGSSVVVGWNVTQRCSSHAENACQFARLMLTERDATCFVAGLCSSKHAVVSVSAGQQMFVAVLGRGISIANRVAIRALDQEIPVLYALSVSGELPSSLDALLVLNEKWHVVFDTTAPHLYALYSVRKRGAGERSGSLFNAQIDVAALQSYNVSTVVF